MRGQRGDEGRKGRCTCSEALLNCSRNPFRPLYILNCTQNNALHMLRPMPSPPLAPDGGTGHGLPAGNHQVLLRGDACELYRGTCQAAGFGCSVAVACQCCS